MFTIIGSDFTLEKKKKEMKISLNIIVNIMKVIRLKSFSSSTGLPNAVFSLMFVTKVKGSRSVRISMQTDWFIVLEKALIVRTNCKNMVIISRP